MISQYQRKAELVAAVQYTGTAQSVDEINALQPTITWGEGAPGGIIYDWDVFQWRPFQIGDWIVRDERGIIRPIGNDPFTHQFELTS